MQPRTALYHSRSEDIPQGVDYAKLFTPRIVKLVNKVRVTPKTLEMYLGSLT